MKRSVSRSFVSFLLLGGLLVLACATKPSSPAETPATTSGQATRIPPSLETSATPRNLNTATPAKANPTSVPEATPEPNGQAQRPDQETPATTIRPSPTEESTQIPTQPDFLFTPIPATPRFPQGEVGPINEEQLQREVLSAAFSTFGWSTNFQLRSVYYSEIMGGGPGKDDIPPIDQPVFETAAEAGQWLTDREPVQVVNIGDDVRAYPPQIMIWHEVINDTVGGRAGGRYRLISLQYRLRV